VPRANLFLFERREAKEQAGPPSLWKRSDACSAPPRAPNSPAMLHHDPPGEFHKDDASLASRTYPGPLQRMTLVDRLQPRGNIFLNLITASIHILYRSF
jgi:hypothetical protein